MRPTLHPQHLLTAVLLMLASLGLQANALDAIVALVNDDIITRSELDSSVRETAAQLTQQGTQLPSQAILEQQVLERMITNQLQLQTATRLGITVDDATLSRTIASIARNNNISLNQLRETLENDGINFTHFREKLRREIIINRLRQKEVVNRIVITEQDVRSHMAREAGSSRQRAAFHIQHILIATPEGAAPEDVQAARGKAEQLVLELREGADFSSTAIRESDGRQALEGGDLGWIEAARVPSIFTHLMDQLEPGDISDPVRNASGFHIIKLVEVRGAKRHLVSQTHARHILINTNEIVSDSEAKRRLQGLRERILNGEPFEPLARAHSDDKASAIKGGDLGWLNPGDTVPAFEQQMDTLAAGEISEPFKSPFGWHIVQLLERRNHDNTEQIAHDNARKSIRKQKSDEAIELWLRRLRDEAYVEIHLEPLP
jgi:peptidyl-prolyl cis-trans isomerase SurA